jgi:hypothetical protein
VVAVGFGVIGLAAGMFQLVLLAPLLWVMGTQERRLARAMAHRYAYDGDGYVARGGAGFAGGRPSPRGFGPAADRADARGARDGVEVRRFVIRQRDGRTVIEVLR